MAESTSNRHSADAQATNAQATNAQVTDATTQADLSVLGTAPAVSVAAIYQNLAHATSLAMLNAVQQQQQAWIVQAAVTAKIVRQLLESPSPVDDDDDMLHELFGGLEGDDGEAWYDEGEDL